MSLEWCVSPEFRFCFFYSHLLVSDHKLRCSRIRIRVTRFRCNGRGHSVFQYRWWFSNNLRVAYTTHYGTHGNIQNVLAALYLRLDWGLGTWAFSIIPRYTVNSTPFDNILFLKILRSRCHGPDVFFIPFNVWFVHISYKNPLSLVIPIKWSWLYSTLIS